MEEAGAGAARFGESIWQKEMMGRFQSFDFDEILFGMLAMLLVIYQP